MRFPSSLIAKLAIFGATVGSFAAATAPAQAAPIGAYTTKGAWSFVSAPSLHPPVLKTLGRTVSSKLAAGNLLIANTANVGASGPMTGQSGPLMIDNKLSPVWFAPVPLNVLASTLQQETYNAQPVLVYWQGVLSDTGVTKKGQVIVVDQHYRTVAKLRAKAPWVVSLHDAQITGSTIWVTVYRTARAAGRPVLDSGAQEYDLKTGKLLKTWDALKHIALGDSQQPAPNFRTAWDAYHINTVEPLAGDQILVSMRNTSAAYLINVKTGKVVWTLGGRHSSFKGPSNTHFAWQHDVQLLPGNEITMFADNCCALEPGGNFGPNSGPSSGLVLKLNVARHSVSRIRAFLHHPARDTAFLGSMQLLPNGNALIGYGSLPYVSEYDPSGRLLLDAVFPRKDQTYRARFSSTWVGTPASPPSGAARRKSDKTTVYASWNGATQVASWQVLGGSTAASLQPLATRTKAGFETAVGLGGDSSAVYEVRALDAQMNVIGTSRPFTAR